MTIKKNKYSALMCLFLFFLFSADSLPAENVPDILLINSNANVEKYRIVQEEFKKSLAMPVTEIDLGSQEVGEKELRTARASLVYCIGAKAYSLSSRYLADTPTVFSSLINWQRLSLSPKAYGVSNELNARMPIYMFRSIFPEVKKIGILYSREYTLQWFRDTAEQAGELGIEIVGTTVSGPKDILSGVKELASQAKALWLIPDPMVMPEKQYLYDILKICQKNRMPVFTYHSAFVELGAVLSVAVDEPTIGRQAAGIAAELLSGKKPQERVQFPAGSDVTLDLKKAEEYGLEYNRNALGLVNNIIR
ncbi:MAG: ABC transporter substrate binding protein [Desulfobacterales bacterium]